MGQNSSSGSGDPGPFRGVDMLPFALNVLEFCDWESRVAALSTNKLYAEIGRRDQTYRWYCERLALQHGIFSSYEMGDMIGWKKLFLELYPLRDLWQAKVGEGEEAVSPPPRRPRNDRFKVNVFVRFRPSEHSADAAAQLATVTLPLHQRMALIRMSHGLKSKREVLQVLMKEGSWFGKKWEVAKEKKGKAHKSPPKLLPKGDHASGSPPQSLHAGVQSLDPEFNRLVMVTPDVGMREFAFDGVFPTDVKQRTVYDKVARRLVMDCLNGFNTTAIVYGQTGSGKTYTMFGPDGLTSPGAALPKAESDGRGVVYRACSELLFAVFYRRQMGIETKIGVSYVEVFGDTVTDLLRNGARCGQSKVSAQSYVLTGAVQQEVSSLSEIMHFLRIGEEQKRRAATMMNERSSRAHSILIISLQQKNILTGVEVNSKMFLADLGGSEQIKKSKVENISRTASTEALAGETASAAPTGADAAGGVENAFSTGFEFGERMRETVYINLGLLALKKCIEALNNNSPYVPYQDSKLTMLLSTGLGGDSKTSVIICGNMEPLHAAETLNALRFGEQCSKIEQQARNNAAILASVLAKIDDEIAVLEAEIVRKERWEERIESRLDTLAEDGTVEAALGGKELKKVYAVVGAEEERIRLEQLLRKKAELTGSDFKIKSKAVAFGKESLYKSQFGESYNPDDDIKMSNVRFEEKTDLSSLPKAVRSRKSGRLGWRVSEANPAKLEQVAKKVDRNKLRYSGLSA